MRRKIGQLLALALLSSVLSIAGIAAASTALGAQTDCVGSPDQNINRAQANYSSECGVEYNSSSGFHKCDWVTDGWRCQGPGTNNGISNGTNGTAIFDLDVRQNGNVSVLSWDEQVGSPSYTVYRYRADLNSTNVEEFEWTTTQTSTLAPVASNDFYIVAVSNGDTIVARSGLTSWRGECVDSCTSTGSDSTILTPDSEPLLAGFPGVVAAFCIRNPRSCAQVAGDIINMASQIIDLFIQDNPASVVATEDIDDLESNGFVITDEDSETDTVTLVNGTDTVTVQSIETVRGEAGQVVTTTTNEAPDGQVQSVTRVVQEVREDGGNSPQVHETFTSILTNYYDGITREWVGRSVILYQGDDVVAVDCTARAGTSTCSVDDVRPASNTDDRGDDHPVFFLDDSDGDGLPNFLEEDQTDPDGDGLPIGIDADPFVPSDPDTDNDGIPDSRDHDDDGDGIPDDLDPEPKVPFADNDRDRDERDDNDRDDDDRDRDTDDDTDFGNDSESEREQEEEPELQPGENLVCC